MIVRGDQIRALREDRGYTLQEMARRANLSVSYVSEIERGSKRPSLKSIEKLAAALNVSKSRLVWGELTDVGLSLGEKMRLVRGEKNLSMQELADKARISASYLSEIERGAVFPALGTLKKIAGVLNISPAALMSQECSLGRRLKTMREDHGLTQAQLANLAEVTAGLVGQIEQGKVQPSLKTLEKLAGAMGVSPCYFITDSGEIEQMLSLMKPELLDLLMQPKVQSVLKMLSNLNEREFQFILNFIKLFKRSNLD